MVKNSIARSRAFTRDKIDPTRITGRVYVASSLSTYDTPRYDRMIDAVRLHFPDADILPARDQFTSNADWRRKWPRMLPTLAAMVFFDDRGTIGRGVYQEVEDAKARDLPIFYLSDDGALYDRQDVALYRLDNGDWARYANPTVSDAPHRPYDSTLRGCPLPHTPAWFALVARINATQARMTAEVVARTGRVDVCSICGDTPANDYQLAEPPFQLIRLCDDCRVLQQTMFGLKVRRLAGSAVPS